jgi:hypothetical protein
LIVDLCASSSVGEVLVIDNDPKSAPPPEVWSIHGLKLRFLKQAENIYVNPAWNLGVREAAFDDVALINDDVNFNADVFNLFDDGSLKNFGVIGMSQGNYSLTRDLDLYISQSERHLGWGCMIMFAKMNFVPIPEDLKIWCGDDWLSKHRSTYQLSGLRIDTEMSSTTERDHLFDHQLRQDWLTWNEKYK